MRLYSNEIVFRGHPDKCCDQISDALLDAYLSQDKNSRCAIETMGGKGKIFLTGEVTSNANINVEQVVKRVLNDIGYSTNYEIINNIGTQSPDIALGTNDDIGGAGDQGMMFGYATNETAEMLPKAMVILQKLSMKYDELRQTDKRFLPDGKAQITGIYDNEMQLLKIKDFTISYQNTEQERVITDTIIKNIAADICKEYDIEVERFLINPTGKFLIGGFEGDAGLTGRKIIVDTYGGYSRHGGGAFSGKDPTKVDRSAAYAARYVAKNIVAAGLAEKCEIELAYAIGVAEPISIMVDSFGTGKISDDEISKLVSKNFDLRPAAIIKNFDLRNLPAKNGGKFYQLLAAYGHMGRTDIDVPWEHIDKADALKSQACTCGCGSCSCK